MDHQTGYAGDSETGMVKGQMEWGLLVRGQLNELNSCWFQPNGLIPEDTYLKVFYKEFQLALS